MMAQQIKRLENSIQIIQERNSYGGVSFSNLSVVPGEIFPAKFKMPDLTTKCDRSGDPFIHLKIYISELGPSTADERLKVHLFLKSLTRVALHWFVRLEKARVDTRDDLTKVFYQHYRYNTDIALK